MRDITQRKILIKSHPILSVISIILLSSLACYILTLKIGTEVLIGTQQALFVILSAILFVFHESVIGFQSISKVRNKINKLSSQEVKNQIMLLISASDAEKDYEEFLTTIDKEMIRFKEDVRNFRRNSYILYVIFSLLGLIIILCSLIDGHSTIISITNNIQPYLHTIKLHSINFSLFAQLFLISLWIISAFQAERQKAAMFKYLNVEQIAPNVQKYITAKRTKAINLSIDGQFSD